MNRKHYLPLCWLYFPEPSCWYSLMHKHVLLLLLLIVVVLFYFSGPILLCHPGLKLKISLLQASKYWDYKNVLPEATKDLNICDDQFICTSFVAGAFSV